MKNTSIVFEQEFDEDLLLVLGELREARLTAAKKMLSDLDRTAWELSNRGITGADADKKMLRQELEYRVALYEERLKRPDTVFEDELSLYVDLLSEAAEMK